MTAISVLSSVNIFNENLTIYEPIFLVNNMCSLEVLIIYKKQDDYFTANFRHQIYAPSDWVYYLLSTPVSCDKIPIAYFDSDFFSHLNFVKYFC